MFRSGHTDNISTQRRNRDSAEKLTSHKIPASHPRQVSSITTTDTDCA